MAHITFNFPPIGEKASCMGVLMRYLRCRKWPVPHRNGRFPNIWGLEMMVKTSIFWVTLGKLNLMALLLV